MRMRFVPSAATPIRFQEIIHSMLNHEEGVRDFGLEIGNYLGVKHSYTFTSFMRAIYACLQLIKKVDIREEVVIPRYSCPTFAHATLASGLKIKYCDVNPQTLSIDLEALTNIELSKVCALICVNHFGLSNPMDDITDLCSEKNIHLIEDLGYSFGTEFHNKRLGSFGDFSVLNFKEGKAIPIGGGMAVTNHEGLAVGLDNRRQVRANVLRTFAYPLVINPQGYYIFKKTADILGVNVRRQFSMEDTIRESSGEYDYQFNPKDPMYEISDFQGALGTSILSRMEEHIRAREKNAELIENGLRELDHVSIIRKESGVTKVHYIRYPILVENGERKNVLARLLRGNIEARDVYSEVNPEKEKFHGAYKISREILTLPCHPNMRTEDLEKIVETIGGNG